MIINEKTIITPNLSYKNTIEGVSIKWENEYEVDRFFRYVLVRNKLRTPRSHTDGVEVYRGKDKFFVDKTVQNGETYYYSLYFVIGYAKKSKLPTYMINKKCSFRITALLEGNNANLIYSNFPKMYRRYDNLISKSEEFNKPLYRMCRVFGYEFDKIETHVDRIYDVIDIDKCPDVMLPSLMSALGVEYDWNLSSKENRMLTKIKTLAYSKRGTVTGLRLVLTNLLKSKIDIIVPKTKVKYTASLKAINAKRTITIIANNFQSDFIWIEENYEKFLEVINEFLPKKLNVKLILISNFFDEYIKDKMSDIFTNSNTIAFSDVSRLNLRDSLSYSSFSNEMSDMPYYSKHISEVVRCRLSEVPRNVDMYIVNMSDSVDEQNVIGFKDNKNTSLGTDIAGQLEILLNSTGSYVDGKTTPIGSDNADNPDVVFNDNDNIKSTHTDDFDELNSEISYNEYYFINWTSTDNFEGDEVVTNTDENETNE